MDGKALKILANPPEDCLRGLGFGGPWTRI